MTVLAGTTLLDRWLSLWNGDLAIADDIIAPSLRVHLPQHGMPKPELVHDPETMAGWIGMFQ